VPRVSCSLRRVCWCCASSTATCCHRPCLTRQGLSGQFGGLPLAALHFRQSPCWNYHLHACEDAQAVATAVITRRAEHASQQLGMVVRAAGFDRLLTLHAVLRRDVLCCAVCRAVGMVQAPYQSQTGQAKQQQPSHQAPITLHSWSGVTSSRLCTWGSTQTLSPARCTYQTLACACSGDALWTVAGETCH
jgi:hypothetical protein